MSNVKTESGAIVGNVAASTVVSQSLGGPIRKTVHVFVGKACAMLAMICLLGVGAMGQEVAKNEPKAPAVKPDDKKPAPDTVSIPKEREDKTRLFQAEVKNYTYELKEIESRFREIEAKQKAAAERWQIELISALKLAGVDEKDYAQYEYNQDTLTFTRKKSVAPVTPPK